MHATIAAATLCLALASPVAAQGAAVNPTAAESRTLVILGASYALGWGSPALPGFARVINRGVGGEETAGMLTRFPADVVAARPRAVLIWGLVNNITRAGPEGIEAAKQAAREHYRAMLAEGRAAGIEVIVATEIPWTEPGGLLNTMYGWYAALAGKQSYARRVSAHVAEVNAYLRDLCRREGCRLLDFERVFAVEDGTRNPDYGAADGSHITQAGYAALTDYAARTLGAAG